MNDDNARDRIREERAARKEGRKARGIAYVEAAVNFEYDPDTENPDDVALSISNGLTLPADLPNVDRSDDGAASFDSYVSEVAHP